MSKVKEEIFDASNVSYHPDIHGEEFYIINPTINNNKLEGNFVCTRCKEVISSYDELVPHYVKYHSKYDWEKENKSLQYYHPRKQLKKWNNFHIEYIIRYAHNVYGIGIGPKERYRKEDVEGIQESLHLSKNITKDKLTTKLAELLISNNEPDNIIMRKGLNGKYSIVFEYKSQNN